MSPQRDSFEHLRDIKAPLYIVLDGTGVIHLQGARWMEAAGLLRILRKTDPNAKIKEALT